jgi:hypothetical protein
MEPLMADKSGAKSPKNGELLAEAKEEFERCSTSGDENRRTAVDDIKFARLGEQWDNDILAQRKADNRPALVINKMPAFIRQVVNDSRQNKPQISVSPVDDHADPETADVFAGIIRNIESVSSADVAYDWGVECAATNGFGFWRISIGYAYDTAFDLDVKIERIINPLSVYGDPNSTAADSSDWDVAFVTDRMGKAEFKRKYSGKSETDFDATAWGECKGTDWLNDDGVLIAEWWRREEVEKEIVLLSDGRVFDAEELANNPDLQVAMASGSIVEKARRTITAKKVTQTIMSGAEILEGPTEFPGCYIPIVPVYGEEIVVEGKRYFRSLIHSAKDAQRNFNVWRSASTELVAQAPRVPYIGEEGAFDADDNWAKANSTSLPFLEYSKGKQMPVRQPLDVGPAASVLQEAMNASDDMKAIIGMYDASLGARSNETSGKAIMARQREGDVSTFHFIDNVSRAIRHTGRILIEVIPKVYSKARVMRLMGEDGTPESRPINQQYPKKDEQGQPVTEPQVDETGNPVVDQNGDPIMTAVLAMHDLSVGRYDVSVKSGPSFTSRREEAAAQMTEFVRSFPQAAPVIGDLLASYLDWPGADQIAERLKTINPVLQQQQGPAPIPPELQQQIEQGKQMIDQLTQENEALKSSQQGDMAKLAQQGELKKAEIDQAMELKRIEMQQQFEIEREKIAMQKEVQQMKIHADQEAKALTHLVDAHVTAMGQQQPDQGMI